jgi:hypothetical protein
MEQYNYDVFRSRVDTALLEAYKALKADRYPILPQDHQQHSYQDKFSLAQYLTNTTLAALVNALETLGLTPSTLKTLHSWSSERVVTLRFASSERCSFNKETKRKEENKTTRVTEVSGLLGGTKTITDKVITDITEFHWDYSIQWELCAYYGDEKTNKVILAENSAALPLLTTVKISPRPENSIKPPVELDLSWFLAQFDDSLQCNFIIDRNSQKTRTPRRNVAIEEALEWAAQLIQFSIPVRSYFLSQIWPIQAQNFNQVEKLNISALSTAQLFNPVIPLFQAAPTALSSVQSQPILPLEEANSLLNHQKIKISEKLSELNRTFPAETGLLRAAEARFCLILLHLNDLALSFAHSVQYIEDLLHKQLISALGRHITAQDFHDYSAFHYRRLYRQEFQPKHFSFPIKRDQNSAEGTLEILETGISSNVGSSAILTLSRALCSGPSMNFSLNSACKIEFRGRKYLHSYLATDFSGETNNAGLNLVARARNFSNFLVILGRINGPSEFSATHAMIVESLAEISIPLELEQIPTAKAFKLAVSSLSPEQKRFADSYRALQLNSTLFGLIIVQLRPQLEKICGLPNNSLNKEIELCENLKELFIKYQIPADQLSFDPKLAPRAVNNPKKQLKFVEKNVKNMFEMINGAKKKALEEAQQRATLAEAQSRNVIERSRVLLSGHRGNEVLEETNTRCENLEGSSVLWKSQPKSGNVLSRGIGKLLNSGRGDVSSSVSISSASVQRSSRAMSRRPVIRHEDVSASLHSDIDVVRGIMETNIAPALHSAEKLACMDEIVAAAPAAAAAAPITTMSTTVTADSDNTKNNNNTSPTTGSAGSNNTEVEGKPVQQESEEKKEIVPQQQQQQENNLVQVDFTTIPAALDKKFEELDEDAAVRATIINVGKHWTKKSQESLLAGPVTKVLTSEELTQEKNKAFDLLDALTKSGTIPLDYADLHVIVAATHCFNKSLIETLIQDNINPIEKLERSSLILATTILDKSAVELLKPEIVPAVTQFSVPQLLPLSSALIKQQA